MEMKKAVLFKSGMAFYGLGSKVSGKSSKIALQFKAKDMDDILKSLFVADLSGDGYISTITYDASRDIDHDLKDVSVRVPESRTVLADFLSGLQGAPLSVDTGMERVNGVVMGVDVEQEIDGPVINKVPRVVLMAGSRVVRLPLRDVKTLSLASESLGADLNYYLDAIISRKRKETKNLAILCVADDGGEREREIHVSYIQECPAWKTSYRLVLPDGDGDDGEGTALLSGWGMVENTTSSDWKDVDLTLVAGMPISFRYLIYEPQYIKRPVTRVPSGSTIAPAEIDAEIDAMPTSGVGQVSRSRAMAMPAPLSKPPAEDDGHARVEEAMKKAISSIGKDMGELFEYNIEKPVSIARNQSALVPIVTSRVSAKKALLYDEKIHARHPVACVELENTSGMVLAAGPVTVMAGKTLAGEAMLPFMVKDDVRLLNYALEQSVTLLNETKREKRSIHRVSFSRNYLYTHFFTDHEITYKIRNKGGKPRILYLDHPRKKGLEMKEGIKGSPPPKKTASKWRFTVELPAGQTTNLVFTLREERYVSHDLAKMDRKYMELHLLISALGGLLSSDQERLLGEIVALVEKRESIESRWRHLHEKQDAMDMDQERLRENLRVLGTSAQEKSLKDRFVAKLSSQEQEYERLKKELDALQEESHEIQSQIASLVAKIKA